MKVFVDANVLFSAALSPKGLAAKIIEDSKYHGTQLLTCAYVLDEAQRNLAAKAPHALPRLEKLLKHCRAVPSVTYGSSPNTLPESDRPVWLSALASGCEILLTGDSDFSKLSDPSIKIMSPAQLYAKITGLK